MTELEALLLMVACNDAGSGVFTGRVEKVDICTQGDGGIEVELYASKLPYIRHELELRQTGRSFGIIRLGHQQFQVATWKQWVGNWCWNGGLVAPQEARRLVEYLLQRGFEPEVWAQEGPVADLVEAHVRRS